MAEPKSANGAQTLQRRKTTQKRNTMGGTIASSTTKNLTEEEINKMIRQELGYDLDYLYRGSDEEEQLKSQPEYKKELELTDRYNKCNLIKEKIEMQIQSRKAMEQQPIQAQKSLSKRNYKEDIESDEFSSYSNSDSYSSSSYDSRDGGRRDQKVERKRLQKTKAHPDQQSPFEEGAISQDDRRSVTSDEYFETVKDRSRDKGAPKVAKIEPVKQKEVTLEEFKKITLPRSKLESWCDQIFFKHAIMNAFLRVSHQNRYRICEIVSIKEEGTPYLLNKKETNIQLQLRFGGSLRWFKMILVSNGLPLDAELREMLEARMQAKLPPLTKDSVRRKMLDIKQAKEYQYNPEEIQQMVSKKFEKGLKTGKIGGQNLSYLRISLQNDLNVAVHKLRETKDPKLQRELKAIIEDLEDKLSKLQIAINQQMDKDTIFISSGGGSGAKNIESLESLETKIKENEWLETQEKLRRDPNFKRNTIYTNVRREQTSQESQEQRQKLKDELELMRMRSQKQIEEDRQESYYEKMERLKREYVEFHQNLSLGIDAELKSKDASGQSNFEFEPLMKFPKVQIHPDWERVFKEKSEALAKSNQNVQVISFDEYFN